MIIIYIASCYGHYTMTVIDQSRLEVKKYLIVMPNASKCTNSNVQTLVLLLSEIKKNKGFSLWCSD